MKQIIFLSSFLVAAMLLVVSYPYISFSSSVIEVGAFVTDIVTFSFITTLLKGQGGSGGDGGSLEASTSTTADLQPPPRAVPFSVPDFSTCRPGNFPTWIMQVNCCPPVNTSPAIDFTTLIREQSRNLRVRRALHLLDEQEMAKFSRAIELMKELPDDDPRSFVQQGNVHCAYCNGSHAHPGFPDMLIDVHGTWFFFPWHRMYIYFYERILGKLIGDPTFALPYWNWDSPERMQIPEAFADKNSTFYVEMRDKNHPPWAIIDFNYDSHTDSNASNQQRQEDNVVAMYRNVVSGGKTAELFYGKPYYPGGKRHPGAGAFEMVPHATIHSWFGDRQRLHHEFFGSAYLSARDPLFGVHHSNVDRIWNIWKTQLPGGNRTDFTDANWLNSEFMFYDEEARLVKIKVKDCLDLAKLGITYDDSGITPSWAKARPTPRTFSSRDRKEENNKTVSTTTLAFPMKLDKVVRLVVPRQQTKIQDEDEEVLVIQGIKVDGNDNKIVKFDVIINDEGNENGIGPANTEFAGSYWSEPNSDKREGSLTLGGISGLLEGLGAQHDPSVMVTLVPRYDPRAGTSVNIGCVKFDFASGARKPV